MPAEVVELPIRTHVCSECQHAYSGVAGVICAEIMQFVDESFANECTSFEEA